MRSNALTSCTSKKQYSSKEEANKTVDYLWREKGVGVKVYKCNICEQFHITQAK